MRTLFILSTLIFYCLPGQAQELDASKTRYIEQFKYWAMEEQVRTGVPAAISLAQGILETGSGTSDLCTEANNHFGIKCKKEWTGETFLHDDDRRRECFRKYPSAKDSYIDHSNFLKERAHYAFLFDLETTDYQEWCKGLRKAGYATNPAYATRLIQIIEEYNLQAYTYEAIELAKQKSVAEVVPAKDKLEKENDKREVIAVAPKSLSKTNQPEYDKLTTKNGSSGFWARKGDYLLPEAVQYNIRYAKLLAMNDLNDEPLQSDMFIYLKKKSKKGSRSFHTVTAGESLHSISQNEGVQLKYLYIYNNMYEGEEPAAGEKIYLQETSSRTPKLREGNTTLATNAPVEIEKETYVKVSPREDQALLETKEVAPEVKEIVAREEVEIVEEEEVVVDEEEEIETENKEVVQEKIVDEIEEVQTTQVEKDPRIIKQADKNTVEVITQKPMQTSITANQGVLDSSPVLDLAKAKRVEQLMDDGKKEVDRLYRPVYKELPKEESPKTETPKEERIEKVTAAPATNNTELEKEKADLNKKKAEENKRNNDNKNVSDDVKDLKNKFDSLIYDED